MHREFRDTVETIELDARPPGATFARARGHYAVSGRPQDIYGVLRSSLMTGRAVRVTCETDSLVIVDAVLD